MTNHNDDQTKIENFEVEEVFEGRKHQRYAFTFQIGEKNFKGYFHDDEIQWHHPHPKQLVGKEKIHTIEATIYKLMAKYGIANEVNDLKVEKVFEDRMHERRQFTLKVQGEEFKGFIHEGEIQWFHPQPKQKLQDEAVEKIETEIQEIIEE